MNRPDYVIIGPDPRRTDVTNPGGQLTATEGLLQYAERTGLRLEFIDTLQGSFPIPCMHVRVGKVIRRQLQFLWYATLNRPRKGAIIFSAGPGSFMERGVTGLLARLFRVPAVVCLRSGRLLPYLGAPSSLGQVISALVRAQPRLLVQGNNWLADLDRAGVDRSRVRVVSNWISPRKDVAQTARQATPGRPIRFVYVGWLVVEKGLRELVDACAAMRDAGHDFSLTIVGGGTLEGELTQAIADKALSERITMAGWIAPDHVADFMRDADIFVLPTYFEGFPNALIEAFATGLPAIATSVGAIPDSLSNAGNGFLIPPRDAGALADAMTRYVTDPGLVAEHSRRAIETIHEKHDFKTNCASLFAATTDQ